MDFTKLKYNIAANRKNDLAGGLGSGEIALVGTRKLI
jgi:hypothetical protein